MINMSIRYKIYQSDFPYHVYNRSNNKEHLFDLNVVFPIFIKVLKQTAETHNVKLHHFLLMQNHYHLMISTPLSNLQKFMCTFQTQVSRKINQQMSRINHIFGNRYGATVIKTEIYISRLIQYIYQNPVKAKIASHAMKYSYSTLGPYLNKCSEKYGFIWDPYLGGINYQNRVQTLVGLCEVDLDKIEYMLVEKSMKSPYI